MTFAKKLMRDVATGKLMRDVATGKLMRAVMIFGDDCQYCDPGSTPKYITLTVNGLTDCLGCQESNESEYRLSGVAAVLNGCIVILEQDPMTPCIWRKTYTGGDFGTLIEYGVGGCSSGQPFSYVLDTLYFVVTKCASGGLLINIAVAASQCLYVGNPVGAQVFAYEVHDDISAWICKTAEITDCIVVNTLANTVDCDEGGVWATSLKACSGGLVSIREGESAHYAPPSIQYQRMLPASDSAVQWSRSEGDENRLLVDDYPFDTPDDDTTYTYTNVQAERDLYGFEVFSVPSGSTITSVKVVGRFKRIDVGGDTIIRELLKINGVVYEGSQQQLVTGAYFDKEAVWTLNPNTGLAWTIDDVNGIGANPVQTFGYECLGFQKTVRCTQVYIRVDYEYNW